MIKKILIWGLIIAAVCGAAYLFLTMWDGGKYWVIVKRDAADAYQALRFWISVLVK